MGAGMARRVAARAGCALILLVDGAPMMALTEANQCVWAPHSPSSQAAGPALRYMARDL